MLISETFTSLQGEGLLTGVPSWFCRLSGCNLRCTWCDTPYASWDPEGTTRGVEDLVAEARDSGVRHAVVTGGEPMIFPEIVPLCAGLRAAGLHVTIETAGTVDRDIEFDLMSLSPKLSNSTPMGDPRDPNGKWARLHEQRRIDLVALQGLMDRADPALHPGRARQLKFVVTRPGDLAEIDDLIARINGWRPEEIMLMPEGVTVPDPERTLFVVDACLARGWRYCHRLHIELFGNRRGT
ncbi:MAG: 7-carboxy-7-deazaguanine synthase QueE [Phycisphaeraceae bacterium]|nr:MAG: 7-carboxy-7-deazaguanine synthase QueE [Phycisphaeraceae bacterium]